MAFTELRRQGQLGGRQAEGVARRLAPPLAGPVVEVCAVAKRDLAAGEVLDEYVKQIPLGRLGRPEDVANAVLFLASEESGYISGQVISVCGALNC